MGSDRRSNGKRFSEDRREQRTEQNAKEGEERLNVFALPAPAERHVYRCRGHSDNERQGEKCKPRFADVLRHAGKEPQEEAQRRTEGDNPQYQDRSFWHGYRPQTTVAAA